MARQNGTTELPTHYEVGMGERVSSAIAIATAYTLLVWLGWRLASSGHLRWWSVAPVIAGAVVADLLSGLVHWGADTWGRDDLPVIGPRFLVPFRVHHVNPDDFLRRSFLDANGGVAVLFVPFLLATALLGVELAAHAVLACLAFGLALVGLMTNQIHQWAHMPAPPRVVRWCQDWRLILGRRAHAAHHARPYDVGYCIATGWCNGPLEAVAFFRRLERAVTWATGMEPRRDDERYASQYGSGGVPGATP